MILHPNYQYGKVYLLFSYYTSKRFHYYFYYAPIFLGILLSDNPQVYSDSLHLYPHVVPYNTETTLVDKVSHTVNIPVQWMM